MAEDAGSGVPLVGSRISLISKKDIRYEGVLYNINTSDASLALQNGEFFFFFSCPAVFHSAGSRLSRKFQEDVSLIMPLCALYPSAYQSLRDSDEPTSLHGLITESCCLWNSV